MKVDLVGTETEMTNSLVRKLRNMRRRTREALGLGLRMLGVKPEPRFWRDETSEHVASGGDPALGAARQTWGLRRRSLALNSCGFEEGGKRE